MSAPPPIGPEGSPERALEPPAPRLWLHVLLFALTFVSTAFVGTQISASRTESGMGFPTASPGFWLEALSYSVSLMAILTAHEMGHFIAARRRGVDTTWPWFLPVPFGFGTFGAFIRMRLDRQIPAEHLLRIAAYGPLAGLAVILPVLGIGLALSDIRPLPEDLEEGVALGNSALLWLGERLIVGDLPAGHDVWLHPMAYAGWVGLLLTAVNLIPLGQLDGGHIAYALWGERYRRMAWFTFAALVLLCLVVYWPWLLLCVVLSLLGVEHPPLCPDTPVRTGRGRAIGLISLAFLALCFTPTPFGGIPSVLEALLP